MANLAPQEIRTFFITTVTWGRRAILQSERMALLLIDVLQQNQKQARFALHEFVVMPDHFHAIVTPGEDVSLEKAVQFIKGEFSFRAKRELGFGGEIWQPSFQEHRIKDAEDYARHQEYIWNNPVKRGLVKSPGDFPYSSWGGRFGVDVPPKHLMVGKRRG